VDVLGHVLGELVLVARDELPGVFRQAVIALHGHVEVEQLQARVAGLAVYGALIHVHEHGAGVGGVHVHARVQDAVLVAGVQGA